MYVIVPAVETRAITFEEVTAFRLELLRTFGVDALPDEQASARFVSIVPLGRTYAVFDGAQMVGTSATFEFDVTVPGGTLPMAGLTMVTVRPTHRRRGILRSMMDAYLEDMRGRGEPLGGLWASETPIYGRFGFGVAAEGDNLEFDGAAMAFDWPAETDDVALVEFEDATGFLAGVYDRVRMECPGMLSRSEAWWRERRIHDPKDRRGGATAKRRCVACRDGVVTGYVEYRHRNKWDSGMPNGTVEVVELIAADARAEATLWRFITNVDLYPNVRWWNAPVDSSLAWRTASRRHLRTHRTDSLWLRVSDVPAALGGRTYGCDGRLRLAVSDPGGATSTFELAVEDGSVSCTASDAAADLALTRSALGSLYLGGVSPLVLARAGHVHGSDSSLLLAHAMFQAGGAPWCPEVF